MLFDNWFTQEVFEALVLGNKKPGQCECCKQDSEHIFKTPSCTLYVGSNNEPLNLCFDCSQDYTQMMEDQWREYYSGIL